MDSFSLETTFSILISSFLSELWLQAEPRCTFSQNKQ